MRRTIRVTRRLRCCIVIDMILLSSEIVLLERRGISGRIDSFPLFADSSLEQNLNYAGVSDGLYVGILLTIIVVYRLAMRGVLAWRKNLT